MDDEQRNFCRSFIFPGWPAFIYIYTYIYFIYAHGVFFVCYVMRYLLSLSLLSQQHLIHTRPSICIRAVQNTYTHIFVHALLVVCLLPLCAPAPPHVLCTAGSRRRTPARASSVIMEREMPAHRIHIYSTQYSGVMIVGLAARGCCCGVMNDSPTLERSTPTRIRCPPLVAELSRTFSHRCALDF